MNKELKEQMHKEFREKFVTFKSWSNDSVGISVKTTPEDIENFMDSLIDKTVQLSEERMLNNVLEIIEEIDPSTVRGTSKIYWGNVLREKVKSLITKESDINK